MGGVEEEGGTSRGLSPEVRLDNEVGGKTGTSQNGSDGWYIGITKDLVSGVWVGGDERSIHFKSSTLGQASRMARPIWDKYMQSIYADPVLGYEKGSFPTPIHPLSVEIDCTTFQNPELSNIDSVYIDQPVDRLDENDIL
jgi:penicillin-binding protein 1A